MNERRRSPAGPATHPVAPSDAVRWIPCPTCWGQRRILEPEQAVGRAGTVLVARPCPGCLGIGEVLIGEPAPLPVPAEEPPPPAAVAPAAPPGRDARRAAVALGCALATGVALAAVAPPAAAIAIAALAGLFCHLCLGGR